MYDLTLKGINKDSRPFIPYSERESDCPTIFWMKPRTVGQFQYLENSGIEYENIDSSLLITEREIKDFLGLCEKVENFQFFGEEDVQKLLISKEDLTRMIIELDSSIFSEMILEVNTWSYLNPLQRRLFEIITYFGLVKNEDMPVEERLSYNCDTCQVMERFKDRQCYYLEERNIIKLPIVDKQDEFTGAYSVFQEAQEFDLTIEEFLDEFEDLCAKLYPSVPTYLSLLRLHQFIGWEKEVCVTGLVSDDYLKVLNWALDCKNMGISVYEGAYFNQPNQLIQAFQTINSTISEFERIKMEKAGEKTKSKGK